MTSPAANVPLTRCSLRTFWTTLSLSGIPFLPLHAAPERRFAARQNHVNSSESLGPVGVRFRLAHIRRPGLGLVAVCHVLNLLVISLNGGRPFKDSALHRAGGRGYAAGVRRRVHTGGTNHRRAPSADVLLPLTGLIAVAPRL